MTTKRIFTLRHLAFNRILTAVGQANFTLNAFLEFLGTRFFPLSPPLAGTFSLFLLAAIPRALVTGVAQGSAMILPRDHTKENIQLRERVKGFSPQKIFIYKIIRPFFFLSALFSGVGTFKFVSVFGESLVGFLPWGGTLSHSLHPALFLFALFSAFCTLMAYLSYNVDHAKKGVAKLLVGEGRQYDRITWIITFIHILGRAVFAKYVIAETFKDSPYEFWRVVIPYVSAVAALFTDFFSNIHAIYDLNLSLAASIKNTLLPRLPASLGGGRKGLCYVTLLLGILDSLVYGCGTLLTGASAFKGFLAVDGFYPCLLVFAPVSVFVNYAFNVRKGVSSYIEVSVIRKKGAVEDRPSAVILKSHPLRP